jgi:ferric-dicitrate binding protein FerR (iron transport regulator)
MKKKRAYQLNEKLLMRYFTGGLTSQESDEIRKSVEADPGKRECLEQMEKIWNSSGSIKDFQAIDLFGDWNRLRGKMMFSEQAGRTRTNLGIHSRSLSYKLIRVAALILLAFASAFMLYYYTSNGPLSKRDWITVDVGDEPGEVKLPDGSMVSLNLYSNIAYPAGFKGRVRTVKLEGEAFFEVSRDEKPFVVNVANQASVEVLGTSFNLRADPEKKKVFLSVLTGKVALFPKGKKKHARVVEQNEQAVYQNGSILPAISFDLNFLSWKTRKLVFENTPLPDVVEQLGRHYHKQFLIREQGLNTLTLTGTYANQKLEEILEEIALVLELDFEETDGVIRVTATDVQTNED